MPEIVLSVNVGAIHEWGHDPSAAILVDGKLQFAAEEERFSRNKHAYGEFPEQSIRHCLEATELEMDAVDVLVLPLVPSLQSTNLWVDTKREIKRLVSAEASLKSRLYRMSSEVLQNLKQRFGYTSLLRGELKRRFGAAPPIKHLAHHEAHAISAYYPTEFDEALVFTIDGAGEFDSTVVWRAEGEDLERIRTWDIPNSLGRFYGAFTKFLGYRRFNGEGKVMGLAPYGSPNEEIRAALDPVLEYGLDYDVTPITKKAQAVENLQELLGWDALAEPGTYSQRERDLAYYAQQFIERTVTEIVEHYVEETGISNVCLAGGVALNCKMNKEVVELPCVESHFIQPVAHDSGLVLGGVWSTVAADDVERMTDPYLGPKFSNEDVKPLLTESKLGYERPEQLTERVARELAEGKIVGWFQGKMEMGPRALGNRSILADPRTSASRDRINRYVKHREEWRPFAPSMTEAGARRYLQSPRESPFMIDTFDTNADCNEDIEAVLHPGDETTRPQIVTEAQNPRYHSLLEEFEDITGVPVLLNTSFNDHGEPIVCTPEDAIRAFSTMGIDILAIDDFLVKKQASRAPEPRVEAG